MLFDPKRDLARELGLIGLPQTFFIDAEGRFVASSDTAATGAAGDTAVLGAIDAADLDRQIEAMLEAES